MNTRDVLHYGQQTFLQSLEGISEEDADNNLATRHWNARDIVGHIAAYERVLEDILASQLCTIETPFLRQYIDMTGQEFNHYNYEERKYLKLSEVLAELDSSHEHVMQLINEFTPEMLTHQGTIPWYGKEYSINDYIVYANYGHKREHAAQLKRLKHHLDELKNAPSKEKA